MPVIAVTSSHTLLSVLVDDVAPLVPECPRALIRNKLIRTCRQFLSESRCWRDRGITLLTTVASQKAYAFNVPADAELLQVMSAWDGDTEVDADLPGDDDDESPDFTSSTFKVGVSDDGTELECRPTPSTDGVVLKGSVSYTLALDGNSIPTWIYTDHRDALAAGAAAMLVIQPGKPWSNPGNYVGYQGMFREAIRDASNKAGPVRRRPLTSKPW